MVGQDQTSDLLLSLDSVSKPLILFEESYIKLHQNLPPNVQFNTEKMQIDGSTAYCVILPLAVHNLVSPEIMKEGIVQYSEKEKKLMETFYKTDTGKAYIQTKSSTEDTNTSTSGKRKRSDNNSDDD